MNILQTELSKIEPEELDDYLARGWFRMQQSIFTTHQIIFDEVLYPAIWLRLNLNAFSPDKKYYTLNKSNSKFGFEIKKACITQQHEALFQLYRASIPFNTSHSLHWLLLGDKAANVYNTYMINVYDGIKLVGTGFFDLGKKSAAGICSVYHPEYKKYSLGKYMIYKKALLCKENGFHYFYPGYFVPGYARFDYKLEIGKPALEYFDIYRESWFAMNNFIKNQIEDN
jgi:arginyl-tRNA--protein-N-Asp/Glu arginylyltransferase